ncbi:hypothetical protein PTKIN_Ptkin11bG0023200 [Pterospermum kingtungense]
MLSHHVKLEEVCRMVGYEGCFPVDRIGGSAGIGIMWRSSLQCRITGFSRNHVDLEVDDMERGLWRVTTFYASVSDGLNSWGRKLCRQFWEKIEMCKRDSEELGSKANPDSTTRLDILKSILAQLLMEEEMC